MPELCVPDVRFHRSFLAAMAEFAEEGRTGDDSRVGSDLRDWSATHDARLRGVRHELNAGVLEYGGPIGYDVRRSSRRQGQATAMLRATLPEAHRLGIDPALVTCDHDNLASRRVIEGCGGVLEDRRGAKLRFWVPTG